MNLLRYYHTVKWLKWTQVVYRIFYRIIPITVSQQIGMPATAARGPLHNPFLRKKQVYFDNGKIIFLNHAVDISGKILWNDPKQEKLWLYQLHYFDALNAESDSQSEQAYALLEKWIVENPPFVGNAWGPYPLSLRIVNIIKYTLQNHRLSDAVKNSLYLQARLLNEKCEHHLLGNHLFENYKALCFAGLFFNTTESSQWFIKGLHGLKKEIQEQVLSDGGHFELSPLYHSLILEGLLDLQTLFYCYEKSAIFSWKNDIQRMLSWLILMSRPCNEIAYFNDTSNAIASAPDALIHYANAFGYGVTNHCEKIIDLKASGFVIVQEKNYKMIVDAGNIGPDYLPGHAHADTLSFELYVDGFPVFVNLGVSCYGLSERRLFERGTAAHNTVSVNDKNSSEVWGGFRVAERARIIEKTILDNKIVAAHDGYSRFEKDVVHQRSFDFSENTIAVKDHVSKPLPSHAYFHLHPACKITTQEKNKIVITMPNQKMLTVISVADVIVIDNLYAQSFGQLVDTKTICIPFVLDSMVTIEIL